MLEKVEGIFTNPPSSLPHAGPDLTAEFSPDVLTDITSHMEGYGTVKSGEYILRNPCLPLLCNTCKCCCVSQVLGGYFMDVMSCYVLCAGPRYSLKCQPLSFLNMYYISLVPRLIGEAEKCFSASQIGLETRLVHICTYTYFPQPIYIASKRGRFIGKR